jgi:hypothetical protein
LDIKQAVLYQYPNARFGVDFSVGVDVHGNQYLTFWRLDGAPIPSDDDLKNWWLAVVKKKKRDEITNCFNAALAQGFTSTSLGKPFKLDILSFLMMVGEFAYLQYDSYANPQLFKTATGEDIEMNRDQFFTFAREAREFISELKQKEWQLHQAVDNATTEDEVNAIHW